MEYLQINIPLGKSPALCHEATEVNIENQKIIDKKTKMEISLYRLEMCAQKIRQKTGPNQVTSNLKRHTPSAVNYLKILYVNIPPNQVIPHTHKLK